MGGSSYSDDAYRDRAAIRDSTGTSAFDYDAKVRAGAVPRAVNAAMNPKVTAGAKSPFVGKVMRESRDSDAHPDSLAIGVVFDVTGSMGGIPVTLQTKLSQLMNLLIAKGYAPHPQILFGAIGDAYCDQMPLQIGQFESGLEMEDDLGKFVLEGGGGGQNTETYELAHYFFAQHTSIDCFDKRGKKGYFFTIGDERFYDRVNKDHVKDLIGDTLQDSPSTIDIVHELEQRYHVFHIVAMHGSAANSRGVQEGWRDLLGERMLKLDDESNVAELIALTIGLNEGTVDLDTAAGHMLDVGADKKAVDNVTKALTPFAASSMTKTGSISSLPDVAGGGGVTRL